MAAKRDTGLARLRANQLPYLALFANPIDPTERTWYAQALPHAGPSATTSHSSPTPNGSPNA